MISFTPSSVTGCRMIPSTPLLMKVSTAAISLLRSWSGLQENLTCGRAPEIEESYWGLNGSGDFQDENELILVGAMIDSAKVEICDGYATLHLFRAF